MKYQIFFKERFYVYLLKNLKDCFSYYNNVLLWIIMIIIINNYNFLFSGYSEDDSYRSEFKAEGLVFHFACILIFPEAVIWQKITPDQNLQQMVDANYIESWLHSESFPNTKKQTEAAIQFSIVLLKCLWFVAQTFKSFVSSAVSDLCWSVLLCYWEFIQKILSALPTHVHDRSNFCRFSRD